MIAPSPPNPVAIVAAQPPDHIKRQDLVVLTQTIVTPDSTRTAVITLGNGGHPDAGPAATSAPNDPPSSSGGGSKDSTAGGLSPGQIGIILGCCLGAVVVFIVLWYCLSNARRRREAEMSETPSYDSLDYTYGSGTTGGGGGGPGQPDVSYWPTWRSIPPPVVPTYTARDPGRQWRPSARASATVRQ
ncbi:uncharacterized protein PG986_010677 [Apiospora aurea]|uniref:Mid2 domain-containing protein n=1 Tax=Apiospora aurea TaxID=335848 RepID=A0ABR1Q2Y2_9PEZI